MYFHKKSSINLFLKGLKTLFYFVILIFIVIYIVKMKHYNYTIFKMCIHEDTVQRLKKVKRKTIRPLTRFYR